MSVLYVVLPLDEDVITWLDAENITYPAEYSPLQPITPALVLQVLKELPDVELGPIQRQGGSIRLDIHRSQGTERTELGLSDVTSDDQPCGIGFRNGQESLIETIVEALAQECGALVLYPDYADNIRVFAGAA